MASDKNRSKRQLLIATLYLTGSTEIALKVTSCREIFEIGSLLRNHGKTITLPVNRVTQGPQRGSSNATSSWNGKPPDQVPSYGFMGNVSYYSALLLSQMLIVVSFHSGFRKERPLVC